MVYNICFAVVFYDKIANYLRCGTATTINVSSVFYETWKVKPAAAFCSLSLSLSLFLQFFKVALQIFSAYAASKCRQKALECRSDKMDFIKRQSL
jgi:hypothetical protein